MAVAGDLHPLGARIDRLGLEFLMQCELFDQRVAQFGVVVDDQDLTGVGHGNRLRGRNPIQLREVEHSGVKAQAAALLVRFAKDVMGRTLRDLHVRTAPGISRGILVAGPIAFPVALGRGGIRANKREGDGATPRGIFHLRRLWWRPDRMARPVTLLPWRRIGARDAWCEDPADRRYNRHITIPPDGTGDRLRRDDQLYDLIIEIDHNTRPRVIRRGSAVFVHISRPGLAPTAGCVAMPKDRLRQLLGKIGPKTRIFVH